MFDVIVIGGANLDVRAKIAGPHVEATSNPGSVRFLAGGVARNIAESLGGLGVKTALITAFGNDAATAMLRNATSSTGVDLAMSVSLGRAAGIYVAVLDGDGELVTAVNAMDILESLTWDAVAAHGAELTQARFIVADCNLRRDVLEGLAKNYGSKLIVEPVSVPKSHKLAAALAHGRIFLATPNVAQAKALTGCADPEAASAELLANGMKNLIIHLGPAGAFVHAGKEHGRAASCHQGSVSDVTGAGDAAVAGAVYGLLEGRTLIDAARLGQAAAALRLSSPTQRLTKERLLAMAGS